MVDQAGFVFHPRLDFSGASPDGLIGQDGGLELKCPKTTTHLAYMTAGTVPEDHQYQMLWNMACADREWWDFASFDPRLPEKLRLFVVRMPRDEARIGEIEREVLKLNSEVHNVCTQLGVVVHLPPIEAFKKSRLSKEDLDPDSAGVGDLSVPEDVKGGMSKEMST
jgi:YqaJ-like viral recombinase domain